MEQQRMEQARKQNENVDRLLKLCVEYLYVLSVDDPGTMEMVVDDTGMTEEEVMVAFTDLADDCGLVLDRKVDGIWVKSKGHVLIDITAGEKVWDIDWEVLSGCSIYRTDGWDHTLFFFSDTFTCTQLKEYWDRIQDMFIDGKDWEDFDISDSQDGRFYEFELDDVVVTLRLR